MLLAFAGWQFFSCLICLEKLDNQLVATPGRSVLLPIFYKKEVVVIQVIKKIV